MVTCFLLFCGIVFICDEPSDPWVGFSIKILIEASQIRYSALVNLLVSQLLAFDFMAFFDVVGSKNGISWEVN